MAIPALDPSGLLPIGIHSAELDEVIVRFCVEKRALRAGRILDFVHDVRSTGLFVAIYFDGSFVTKKAEPSDVDVVLELHRWVTAEQEVQDLRIRRLTQTAYAEDQGFSCEVWHPSSPIERSAIDFFQRLKPLTAHELGLPPDTRKGIVRVTL